ncbi:MAG: arylesterase [Gammaproteobacteria bacterium]|nr:MAG: arylesterase [Gammaproteobacteria bacterium]
MSLSHARTDDPVILVLGDSISAAYGIDTQQGWVALLQQQLTKHGFNYRAVNASVSGDTTRTGLNRLDDALQQHKPAIIIVALGGNDGLRGLPFSEIEQSLSRIIEKSQQQGIAILLAGVRLPPNYGVFYNSRFATLFQTLSKKYKVALVPKILDQVADDSSLMQADSKHPTAEGQKQVLQNIWPYLLPLLTVGAPSRRD